MTLKKRYDNYIGGEWVAPAAGEYFENVATMMGQVLCEICAVEGGGCGPRARRSPCG